MRIALACATRRGKLVLEELIVLAPQASLSVFSFPEKPWEPPFVEDIRRTALTVGAEFHLAPRLQAPELAEYWSGSPPDLLLAVSWRYLIPEAIYSAPRLGSFVFHDSLLPANRGFAPTVWAIIKGQSETGASLITMAEEVDAGLVIDQIPVAIGPEETIGQVMDRVTAAYLSLLRANLAGLISGTAPAKPQNESLANSNPRWTPELGRIDWADPALKIFNLIRAVTRPYPGAFTFKNGRKITLWAAEKPAGTGSFSPAQPGMVLVTRPGKLILACGPEGRDRLTLTKWEFEAFPGSQEYGASVKIGQILES